MNRLFRVFCFLMLSGLVHACVDLPKTDPRQFFCQTLDNGLEIVLIHDPDAQNSAAALMVDAGQQDDPKTHQGLAHFVEHMLFIGTEKYPELDYFSNFLSTHGGQYNAFTALDRTQYFFSIKPEFFLQGFDIFSSFFVSPLFSPEFIEKERNAVHAEFKMHERSDNTRLREVFDLTGRPTHPANRFTIGNLDTLNDEQGSLHAAVVNFFETHYSSDHMYFVAVTPDPIETIKDPIVSSLRQIKRRFVTKKDYGKRLSKDELAQLIHIKSLSNDYGISLSFPLPSQRGKLGFNPSGYVVNLLSAAESGSLSRVLRDKGWADGVSASLEDGYSDHESMMHISIDVTDMGQKHIDEIIQSVFSYIQLIKEKGIHISRFHEMQKISMMEYMYYQPKNVLSQANTYVSRMPYYPLNRLDSIGYYTHHDRFSAQKVHEMLDHLVLKNCRIVVAGPNIEGDQVAPHFGVEYRVSRMTERQASKWLSTSNLKFSLPPLSPYMPKSLNMLELKTLDYPHLIVSKPGSKAYYFPSTRFEIPERYIKLQLQTLSARNPKEQVIMSLLPQILYEHLEEDLSLAAKSGISSNISMNSNILMVSIDGKGDQHGQVLNLIVNGLNNILYHITDAQVERFKASRIRALENQIHTRPVSMLSSKASSLLSPKSLSRDEAISAYRSITVSDVKKVAKRVLSDNVATGFYYGNLSVSTAKQYHQVVDQFNLSGRLRPYKPLELVQVPNKTVEVTFDSAQQDTAVYTYYQLEDASYHNKVRGMILGSMLGSPLFEQLRTQEQMGYIVSAFYSPRKSWPGISFVIQSPTHDHKSVVERIQRFLDEYDLEEEQFHQAKKSLRLSLSEPFKTMGQEFTFFANQIYSGQMNYSHLQDLIDALDELTFNDVKSLKQELRSNDARHLVFGVNLKDGAISHEQFRHLYGNQIIDAHLNLEDTKVSDE